MAQNEVIWQSFVSKLYRFLAPHPQSNIGSVVVGPEHVVDVEDDRLPGHIEHGGLVHLLRVLRGTTEWQATATIHAELQLMCGFSPLQYPCLFTKARVLPTTQNLARWPTFGWFTFPGWSFSPSLPQPSFKSVLTFSWNRGRLESLKEQAD